MNLIEFCQNSEYIYIYGVGDYGINIAEFLKFKKINLTGFCVSEGYKNYDKINSLPVNTVCDINFSPDSVGIVISVSAKYYNDIFRELSNKKIYKFYFLNDNDILCANQIKEFEAQGNYFYNYNE